MLFLALEGQWCLPKMRINIFSKSKDLIRNQLWTKSYHHSDLFERGFRREIWKTVSFKRKSNCHQYPINVFLPSEKFQVIPVGLGKEIPKKFRFRKSLNFSPILGQNLKLATIPNLIGWYNSTILIRSSKNSIQLQKFLRFLKTEDSFFSPLIFLILQNLRSFNDYVRTPEISKKIFEDSFHSWWICTKSFYSVLFLNGNCACDVVDRSSSHFCSTQKFFTFIFKRSQTCLFLTWSFFQKLRSSKTEGLLRRLFKFLKHLYCIFYSKVCGNFKLFGLW